MSGLSNIITERNYGKMSWLAILFFIAVVSMTGLIAGNIPLFNDDMYYACGYSCVDHAFCPEKHFNLWDMMSQHREVTNGRFGDMFMPIFVLIPNWIYGIVYACCYGGMILMMQRLSGISFSQNPTKCIWQTGITILLFPWPDILYTHALFLNYFPPAILTLYVIRKFNSLENVRGWSLVCCIFLTFLAGWWHELTVMSMLPSVILYCVMTRSITRNQIIICIAFAAGCFMMASAPSFFKRPDQIADVYFDQYQVRFCILYIIADASISIAAIIACYRKKRSRREKAFLWAMILPQIPVAIITMNSVFECRMMLTSSILILIVFFRFLPGIKKQFKPLLIFTTIIAAVIMLLHLSTVMLNTRKLYKGYKEIFTQAKNSTDGNIYYDFSQLLDRPEYFYLYKSMTIPYIMQYTSSLIKDYTHNDVALSPVPPCFRDFDLKDTERIEAPIDEMYCINNFLFTPLHSDGLPTFINGQALIEYEDGKKLFRSFQGNMFTDKKGDKFVYLLFVYPIGEQGKPKRVLEYYWNLQECS